MCRRAHGTLELCVEGPNAVAGFEIAHARAQRLNNARAVRMGNDSRKFERRISGTFLVVGGADTGGVQADEHLTRPGVRYFHVADFDYLFGDTAFFVPTCQHVVLKPSSQSSRTTLIPITPSRLLLPPL